MTRARQQRVVAYGRLLNGSAAGPQAGFRAGRRVCQPVACSYARATLSTVASANGAPAICSPIGRPEEVNPHGIEMAGRPKTSNGHVFRVRLGSSPALCSIGSIGDGGAAIVGVTSTSTVANDLPDFPPQQITLTPRLDVLLSTDG